MLDGWSPLRRLAPALALAAVAAACAPADPDAAPPPTGSKEAAWVQTDGPRGIDRTTSLHVAGETILLGSFGGVVYSGDGGRSWHDGRGLPAGLVSATAATGDALYAVVDYQALHRSDDGGANWRELRAPGRVISLAASGERLFAVVASDATGEPVALRSDDRGATWSGLAPLDGGVAPYRIFACGGLLFAPSYSGERLFRSADLGETWEALGGVDPLVIGASALGQHGNDLFAVSTAAGIVFRSRDTGATWEASLQIETDGELYYGGPAAWLAESGDGYFLATAGGGVFRWDEALQAWGGVSEGLGAGMITGFGGGAAGTFAVEEDRILRFDGAAERWVEVRAPVRTWIAALAAADGIVLALDLHGRLEATEDGGASWRRLVPPGRGAPPITAVATAGGTIWAGTSAQGIFRSDDGGASWQEASGGFPTYQGTAGTQFREVAALLAADGSLWAATGPGYERNADPWEPVQVSGAGVWRSDDGGASWIRAAEGLPTLLVAGERRFEPLAALAAGDGSILAATDRGALYLSRDGGARWERAALPASAAAGAPLSIAVAGEALWFLDVAGTLFRSDDGGRRFERVVEVGELSALAGGAEALVARVGGGIDRAVAGGGWEPLGRTPPRARVTALVAAEGAVFAGTAGSGVWRLER